MSQPPPPAPGYQPQPNASAPYTPYGTTPQGTPLAPRTNTLAIVALVLGIVVPLGGIICGHIALSQIKKTGEDGRGMALAGTVIGYVLTGLTVLFVIAYIAIIAFAISMSGAGSLVS